MEQDIRSLLKQGYMKEEVLASVLYSVTKNYLNRVVGNRKISRDKIFFRGQLQEIKDLSRHLKIFSMLKWSSPLSAMSWAVSEPHSSHTTRVTQGAINHAPTPLHHSRLTTHDFPVTIYRSRFSGYGSDFANRNL